MKDLLLYIFGVPGILVILFLLTLFYLFVAKYKKARTVGVITLVLTIVFSSQSIGVFFGSFLVESVEFKQVESLKDIDLVVMPSQGVEYNGKVLGWVPSQESFKAGNIAYDLQNRLAEQKVPVLICGGKVNANMAESSLIKDYFDRQSAQIKKTLIEDISKNLYEQVWQCSNIIKHYGAKNPILVVDEISMLRVLALFRERGIEMVPMPVFSIQEDRSGLGKHFPSLKGIALNQKVIKEYLEITIDFISGKLRLNNLFYKENSGE
ncbi:MAG: YdcF family protein [Proteobacteria bacterium]|nr:YdcF family protein [Pseudomonadota bacterium]